MDIIPEHRLSDRPADIILFCDTDASLFKAIVRHYSPEVDGQIAEELGYINLHHRRRTGIGLTVNYLQFEYFSPIDGRLYRITRFDSLEDASKFLLSEPCNDRGAIIVCPSSRHSSCSARLREVEAGMVSRAKALVRKTLGFGCVALMFNDTLKSGGHATECREWITDLMNFSENGIVERGLIKRIDGLSKAILASKQEHRRERNAWWRPSPAEHLAKQLHSTLNFFHSKLPQYSGTDEEYFDGKYLKHEHQSQILTARFYCFDVKEGGSPMSATDNFRIAIAGSTVAECHIVDSPGVAIQPGKLVQDNVLIWLKTAVAVESRDQFVVRRMDGANVGVGVVVSCN